MLDESTCNFRGVRSIISLLFYFFMKNPVCSLLFYFLWKTLLANNVDPDQMPHYVASDLGQHCLPMTLLQISG